METADVDVSVADDISIQSLDDGKLASVISKLGLNKYFVFLFGK
jgi:hypothetical protein